MMQQGIQLPVQAVSNPLANALVKRRAMWGHDIGEGEGGVCRKENEALHIVLIRPGQRYNQQ
jgi:hypothetical protein